MLIDFSLNLSFLVYKMGIMIKGNGTCPVPSMHAKYAGGYHAKVPRGSLDTRLQQPHTPSISGSSASCLAYVYFWTLNTSLLCQHQINNAQKHTECLCVLSVWTGRGFPGRLEIISCLHYIFFFFSCWKKQIGFFMVPSSPCPYFLLWRQISYFFKEVPNTYNQSA